MNCIYNVFLNLKMYVLRVKIEFLFKIHIVFIANRTREIRKHVDIVHCIRRLEIRIRVWTGGRVSTTVGRDDMRKVTKFDKI